MPSAQGDEDNCRHLPCPSIGQRVQRLLEAVGMGTLRFRERLEPVRDFTETLVPGDFGHAWIHVGIFVRFTGDRGLQVLTRAPEREIRRRIAGFARGCADPVVLAAARAALAES